MYLRLVDRLINRPLRDGAGHVTGCQAAWERNMGPGLSFADPQAILLPNLKWATQAYPPGNPTYGGGATANINGTSNEGCSLNYQETNYINSHITGGAVCPGDVDPTTCKTGPPTNMCYTGRDCIPGTQPSSTILAYRWMDLDGD